MPDIPKKIIILNTVDSTNNYAMAMIQKEELVSGNAVFAIEQTAGKGRRGKEWNTVAGENIIMSVIAEMQWLPTSQQFHLSVAAALACHDLISKYSDQEIAIKWPNDLFINDSKTGGILIENVIKGTLWQWAVIGIGINVNQMNFEEYNLKPASLKKMSGIEYDVLQLATELQQLVLNRIQQIKEGKFDYLLKEYNEKLYGRERMVKLNKGNIVFETTIKEVSATGQLITKDVFERQFNFDEVSFRGILNT